MKQRKSRKVKQLKSNEEEKEKRKKRIKERAEKTDKQREKCKFVFKFFTFGTVNYSKEKELEGMREGGRGNERLTVIRCKKSR